jgi:hypothetical protein
MSLRTRVLQEKSSRGYRADSGQEESIFLLTDALHKLTQFQILHSITYMNLCCFVRLSFVKLILLVESSADDEW